MTSSRVRLTGFAVLAAALALAPAARAKVGVPALFAPHMVLQAGVPVPVWGTAAPDEAVTVSFAGQTKTAKAGADGTWRVALDPLAVSDTPATLTIQGANTLTFADVLVGDVWLCSGQSNMAMATRDARDATQECAAATFPAIRMFGEGSPASPTPQTACRGVWTVCSPHTVGGFSATAYFFGRDLHRKTGRPIGLINSSVGGTPIEAWISWDAQKELPTLKTMFAQWDKRQAEWTPEKAQADYEKALAAAKANVVAGKTNAPARLPRKLPEPRLDPHHPATLFNGKIAPLIPYAIRGAIWYQGESNGGDLADQYGLMLSTMIRDWRARWGYDFPFAWVQLPEFGAPQKSPVELGGWPFVREGMLKTLRVPQTGMANALGTGEATNVHPKNKQEVGRRLALWALAEVYGQKDACFCGPLPAGHKVDGHAIVVTFTHADGGLVAKGGAVKGFAIAGADKKWVWADAKIVGDTVVVSSPNVAAPVAVRYAWASNPAEANLANGAGLPASPFRTDDTAKP